MSGRKKCICQLCTCGRHMCLHRSKDTHLVLGEDSASKLKGGLLQTKAKRGQEEQQWNLPNGGTHAISAEVDQINAQQVLANAECQEIALEVHNKGNSQVNVSSTGNSWSAKQVPHTLLIRPSDNLKHRGEADFTTSNQLDYTKKSSDSHADFQAASTNAHHDSWYHNQVPKVDQINAQQVLSNAERQEIALAVHNKRNNQVNVSSTGNSWSAKQVPHTLLVRPSDNLKHRGEAEFTTSNQLDYTKKSSDVHADFQAASTNAHHDSWYHNQVPKTLPIKKPDSLTLNGPLILETTNKSDFTEEVFQSKAKEIAQGEKSPRPRTSLKLSGEFQSDSSYQQAFTPKHATDVVKVKKGTSVRDSHLKPEGDMTFDTTSLDYRAALIEKSKLESEKDGTISLKPKPAKPQSGIEIPEVPLEDETTAVTDYKRWNVEKPQRYRPPDTLQLGDGITDIEEFPASLSRKGYSDAAENENDPRWHVSRPVVRKPQNNLGTEVNLSSSNDADYSSRRSRYSHSNLETVTERSEREIAEAEQSTEINATEVQAVSASRNEESNAIEQQASGSASLKESEAVRDTQTEAHYQNQVSQPIATDTEPVSTLPPAEAHEPHADDSTHAYQNGEQMEYVTWDQIRPKPIRPQSNLKQEGGMEFNTTNRSEFVQRSTERVKGIRPKTTTKVFEGDFDATTMNQIMFTPGQSERMNPIRPKSNLHLENGQFVDETTTAREYQQWEIKRPSPIVHKSNLMQQGSIDFTTTNRTEFEEKRPEKVYPIRPTTTNRISGEFDLTTTNQLMHGPFPIERVQKIVPQSNLRMSSGAFNSETTNRTQFQEYHVDRPKPIRPISNLHQEGSMDFTTMNQLQFDEKPMEKVTQFRPQTSSKITGDFDGVTTNRMMYTTQPVQKPQMIKPKGNIELEKGAFERDTTKQLEFQQWQAAKSEAITPRNNLQQEGDIDFTTTNQLQFAGQTGERVSQIRPKTNPKITGEFDGTTTNRMMYQNVIGEKPKAVRPKNNLQVEKGSFIGETTNNREFQNWGYEKPTPIKPKSSLRQEGTMDYTTTNSMQFEPKTSERPAQIRPTTSTKISGDFDGTTTNQIMYQNNPLETVKGIRPSTNIHLEGGKFEDQTTARREYQPWEMVKAEKPIKHTGTLTQEGTMDFTTSNRTDYGAKALTKTEAIRPHTSSPITGEFDGTTTNQMMYQAQTAEGIKREPFKPKPNLSQEGNMDFVTSNQLEYEQKPIERALQIRPKTHTKLMDEKFHGETTNQVMFQAPMMEAVHAIRPPTNLKSNEGAFQSSTTVTDTYQQWKTERPKAFQLATSLKQEGEMSFETTSSSEFQGKSFERVHQIRPKTSSKIEGDFVATTTNQAMFHQPEKVERVQPIRHQNNLYLEQGRFSDETTTNREYKQWVKMGNQIAVPKKKLQAAGVRTQREKPNRRKEISKLQERDTNFNVKGTESWRNNAAQIDALGSKTERNSMEVQKDITSNDLGVALEEQAINKSNQEAEIKQDEMKLQGRTEDDQCSKDISTVKSDYGGKQGIRAGENVSQNGDISNTTSKTDDVQQAMTSVDKTQVENVQESATESMSKGLKEKKDFDSWKLAQNEITSTARMSNETVKQEQMSQKKQQSTKHYRPPDNLRIEHVPFDGTSTNRTEYKKWEARRASLKKRNENLKQEGEMRFDTTSNDYSVLKDHQMSREATRSKIKEELKKGSLTPAGSMEFSTTSKSSYVGLSNVARPKNLRPRSSLKLGVSDASSQELLSSSRSNPEISSTRDNYDFTSTSRASYMGQTGSRARANRPSTSQKVGEGAFEGQSMSRSSFTVPQETVVKSKTIKPESHNILHTDNGFTGDTTYRSSFETKKGHCPVIDLEAGKLPLTFKEERNGHVFYAPRVQG